MKNYFLIFMLVYVVQYIFCDSFLSKFHQNDYKMKDMRIQLMHFDKKYFNHFQLTAFKYNRSTTAHNLTWNYAEDVKDKQEILVQAYKFLSNEYRECPVRFQVNLQKAFEANLIGAEAALKCGNFTNCIFQKETTYHICNFVIDEKRFPPLIPSGKYKLQVLSLYLNSEIAALDIFVEVYRPIPYPKRKIKVSKKLE